MSEDARDLFNIEIDEFNKKAKVIMKYRFYQIIIQHMSLLIKI